MPALEIKNVDIFDGQSTEILENHHVLIEGQIIKTISHQEINSPDAQKINGNGKLIMPGLIDAHYHACLVQVDGYTSQSLPPSLLYPASAKLLENSLKRGFTSVRDAGGADFGLADAVEKGIINGPTIYFSGRPLTQTGGHGDHRSKHNFEPCLCSTHSPANVNVVDGEDNIRKAVREEFRKGAHQIKMMLNGGISSDSDPVWLCQFTDAEIKAAVEEAERRRSYVMAHLYQDQQIRKAVELGIRTVEHGNFLQPDTARFMAKNNSFLVPTLITYQALNKHGHEYGFEPENFKKLKSVLEAGISSLENAISADVKIGFGTDLLGAMHSYQCDEFQIRKEVQTPFEILKSATSVNAEILGKAGKLGVITQGATADLILLNKNPLNDLSVLDNKGSQISLVIKNGDIVIQN